jgi:glycosyltransferase involved in cell wall biosynthesis
MTGDPFAQRSLYPGWLIRGRKWLIYEKFMIWALRSTSRILAVGEMLARALILRGVERERITVLPQPFDASEFRQFEEDKWTARRSLGLDRRKKIALYAGALTFGKGTDRLARIARRVHVRRRDIQFCVLGDGPMRKCLEEFAPADLVCLGNVPRPQMVTAYRAADILVHPTRSDGLPNVILEALAAGIPVVATPVGEIPNYVSNIAEDEDGISRLITQNKLIVDPLPPSFEWQTQRDAYRAVFSEQAEFHLCKT